MRHTRDYTIPNGLGIRISDEGTCQVIRRQRGVWKTIGQSYELPLSEKDLQFGKTGIPASVIAVAVRVYEMNNPGTSLRRELTCARALQAAS
jgi:hypothetical protein